jgi:serine/threonine protein kinase
MTYFYMLPEKIKNELLDYFRDKPSGEKLKYGASLGSNGDYVLKNSYIKLGKDIYALGRGSDAMIGQGTYGRVKYIQSLTTNASYVVKIQIYKPQNRERLDIDKEKRVLYDLGWYQDDGDRLGSPGTRYARGAKNYIVMPNAGVPLSDYLDAMPCLNSARRFDLAIRLCWAVHRLHDGSSRTRTAYAHRDLKPANIARQANGALNLIDWGLAETNPEQLPPDCSGAPIYLPNMITYLNRGLNLKQLDIVALKRIIYMPNKLLCSRGYVETQTYPPFGCVMIFSKQQLSDCGLLPYVDTSVIRKDQTSLLPEQWQGNALALAGLFVLGRYDLVSAHAKIVSANNLLAYAVIAVFFANEGKSDDEMRALICSSIQAYQLHKIAPKHADVAQKTKQLASLVAAGITSNLNQALLEPLLLDLVTHASPLIKQAAASLWQAGFCRPNLLAHLKNNDSLAKKVVDCCFDRNWVGLKALFTRAKQVSGGKVDDAVPVVIKMSLFPMIPSAAKLALARKKESVPSQPATRAIGHHLPTSFFLPPLSKRVERNRVDMVSHPRAWR